MTIEETIKILKDGRENLYGVLDYSVPYKQQTTLVALDMAVKSLEAWDKVKEELKGYGSLWVSYTIKDHTDKAIEDIVENVLKQAKQQFVEIIDKHLLEVENE